jgi:prolyl-tRNA editing enzyme YbaK/EbsC (Cys-tRNA(Pro) deacylase)
VFRLHKKVALALEELGIIYELLSIDPDFADTGSFCVKYNYPLEYSGNTIIVASKKGPERYVACIIQASASLNVNQMVTRLMDTRKASFASSEKVVQLTGMMIGGVTPFGLPQGMAVYADEELKTIDYLILGSGDRGAKVKIEGCELHKIPNICFVTGLSSKKSTST